MTGILAPRGCRGQGRGRVASVSFLFVSASNELGEFESGVTARLFGPVGAAVFGGIASLAVTGVWARIFPALRKVDRLGWRHGEAARRSAGQGGPAAVRSGAVPNPLPTILRRTGPS